MLWCDNPANKHKNKKKNCLDIWSIQSQPSDVKRVLYMGWKSAVAMLTGWRSDVLYVCSGSPGIQGLSQPLSLTLSSVTLATYFLHGNSISCCARRRKKGTLRDLNVPRTDWSYRTTDWMELSYSVLHALASNWLCDGAMEQLSIIVMLLLYVTKDVVEAVST